MFSEHLGQSKIRNYTVGFFVVAMLMVLVFLAGWRLAVNAENDSITNSTNSTGLNNTEVAPTIPLCTSVECLTWSTCSATGMQSCISSIKYPNGCQGGALEPSPKTCSLACTEFIYGEWSTCQASSSLAAVGNQYRTFKGVPEGCKTYPDTKNLHQECSLIVTVKCVPGDWYCGSWSSCTSTGQRTRQCTLLKNNCLGSELVKPAITETCSPTNTIVNTCSEFVCNKWSGCNGTNTAEGCLEFTKIPTGCTGEAPANLKYRNCVVNQAICTGFVCNKWSGCNGSNSIENCLEFTKTPTGCIGEAPTTLTYRQCINNQAACTNFICKAWSGCNGTNPIETCTGGFTKLPENCSGEPTQELYSRSCKLEPIVCKVEWACDGAWSACQPSGWRYQACRQTNCFDTIAANPGKKEACQYGLATTTKPVTDCKTDRWLETNDWTPCVSGRKQKIYLKEFDCPSVETAMPIIFENCNNLITNASSSEGNLPVVKNIVVPTVELKIIEPERIFTKEQIQINLPSECQSAGVTDNSACELYLRRQHSTDICLEAGAQNKAECRKVVEQQYQKPSQCTGLSEVECSRLVNQVILADYIEPTKLAAADAQATTLTNQVIMINPTAKGEDKFLVQTIPLNKNDQVASIRNFEQAQSISDVLSLTTDQKVNLMVLNSSVAEEDKQKKVSAVVMIDQDADGLPDDQEKRFGTDPNKADTDNDGYSDLVEIKAGYNPLGLGKLTTVLELIDKAIVNQAVIEQPQETPALTDDILKISEVKNTDSKVASSYQIKGLAKPNQIVTLYIYSQMPLVLTTKADANGNWTYQLDKSLNDGKHEVYVAINDDSGRISSQATPLSFFIKEAKALTMDEYIAEDQSAVPNDNSSGKMLAFYIAGGSALILSVLMMFILFRKKLYS